MVAKTYHFVGIGGYGMSGLAQILLERGMRVTGSDVKPSERTVRLAAFGATVFIGHDPSHVALADVVVYSTDVPYDNPELEIARRRGLAVVHRSEVLAGLINNAYGIAVTGTHGKTTVTSMIACVMEHARLDPTAVIGAEVDFYGSNAKLGNSPYVVAEADESDGSFVRYHPRIAVVTNIEPEHLDNYGGEFHRLREAFATFLGHVPAGGLAVISTDDPRVREIGLRLECPTITYGLGPEAGLTARDIVSGQEETTFRVIADGNELGEVSLVVPGVHNVANALAAVAVGRRLGVTFADMAAALRGFHGAKRRFQVIGRADSIMVVDDYAHHPTEIMATLRAARQRTSNRVIAVFQPQRYSRTRMLLDEFGRAFGQADEVILTDIYSPPGDRPIDGVTAEALAALIRQNEKREVNCISRKDDIVEYLMDIARPGDVILTMGAGDIWTVATSLAQRLQAAGRVS